MKVIGIDPGLKATGFGVIEIDDRGQIRPVDVGTIEPKAREPLAVKLLKIHQCLDEIILRHKPEVMALEKIFSHCEHPATAAVMGHTRGVICLVCMQRGVELAEYSVKRIRKAVVGNGNANKEQTRRVVANILRIDAGKLTLDASDALALALGHASMSRVLK